MEHKLELYKQQVAALEKENKELRDQLTKIQHMATYFETETKSFLEDENVKNKKYKFMMFKKYIETLHQPRNLFQLLLFRFYQYIIQHLELEKLQSKLKTLS